MIEEKSETENLALQPPPMRICHKGWLRNRDLTYVEAEAYHLREAAKLAGGWFSSARSEKQAWHIEQARLNRHSQRLNIPAPRAGRTRLFMPNGDCWTVQRCSPGLGWGLRGSSSGMHFYWKLGPYELRRTPAPLTGWASVINL